MTHMIDLINYTAVVAGLIVALMGLILNLFTSA